MAKPILSHLALDLTGKRFGKLIVLSFHSRKGRCLQWQCRCDCGVTVVRSTEILRRKNRINQASCGCVRVRKPTLVTHGMSKTPEWSVWHTMKKRCYNENQAAFKYYGGRGITVCDRWLIGDGSMSGSQCFLADMGPRPSNSHTLDRVDNDGNYEPGNCRWATWGDQAKNRRLPSRLPRSLRKE